LGKDEPEDVFLSPPNLLDTQEHRGYRYPGERKAFHDDLRLSDFFEIVLKRDDAMAPLNVQVEQLQKWKIRHYTTDEASASDSFSVYDAIVYETSRNNKLYTLTRGEWFEIDENYVTSVTNEIAQVEDHPTLLLPDARANEKEGPYNERAANESNGALSLLDKKLVAYGGGYSKMEV
jgi:uncharacterized protein (TIGR04141 family)